MGSHNKSAKRRARRMRRKHTRDLTRDVAVVTRYYLANPSEYPCPLCHDIVALQRNVNGAFAVELHKTNPRSLDAVIRDLLRVGGIPGVFGEFPE